jgi:hypothetical protein
MREKGGIAMEMKASKGFLTQYFSLFGAFSALFSSLLPPLPPIAIHWVEGCRD